ncbi:DoxX family protein [Leptospira harrisiae]|uniref:DoxX family protein n=1 Tax=Leptospira harrisiae TaxID=2023189 RepID=A0A2N0AQH3_9LEPT|nr:DoxX family protein [Leptospira harrisiae]PJZ86543.1 DoxX family protein [Leptospira harrisiae]PKA10103.1 DoxX family protein [Leptospira harrisiae]
MKNKILIILQITIALIFLQTLFFKFGAAPESVYIFSRIGLEPFGRIGSGIVELIAVLLLLWPPTTIWGTLLSLFVISGAIYFHITVIGISVLGDHGLLFFLALVVFFSSVLLLYLRKDDLWNIKNKFWNQLFKK